MDKTETLIDMFDNGSIPSNGAPWWTYGTITENAGGGGFSLGGDPGGQVLFSLVGGSPAYSGMYANNSDDYYDLTDSYIHVRVDDAGPTASWTTADVSLNIAPAGDSTNRCFIDIAAGNVIAVRYIDGEYTWLNSVPYNSTAHRWLRMTESNGQLLWQYASDQQYLDNDWQTLYSMATPVDVSTVTVEISCGHWDTESGSGSVKLSQFNIPAKIINSIEDLDDIRNNLAGSRIVGHYKLARDLDFDDDDSYDNPANKSAFTTGTGWVPLGQSGNPWFGAHLDGDGHTISNMKVTTSTTGIDNGGLIGVCDSMLVEDLGMINPRVNENATNDPWQAGALIAGIDPEGVCIVRRCFTQGGIIRADDHAGGLIGVIHEYATTDLLIEDCYNDGTTVDECGSFQDGFGHGGLLGSATYIDTSTKDIIMRRCWSNGAVTPGATTNCGGLVGFDGTVGLVVSNSFWDTQTSGFGTSAGGTGRTTAQMQDVDTYDGAGWDIVKSNVWSNEDWFIVDDINGNFDYPRLGWQMFFPTVEINSPAHESSSTDTTPEFQFTGSQKDGHDLHYIVTIADDVGMSNVILERESFTHAGFSNTEDGGDTDPFTADELISFIVQAGDELAVDTYYVQITALDAFQDTSGLSEIVQFTVVDESPGEPTGPPVMIKSGGTFVAAVTKVKVSGTFQQLN